MPSDDTRVVRTPVGVARLPPQGNQTVPSTAVVCDDGSVWVWGTNGRDWWDLPPIPGTRAALERELES